jgi:hypothetical protein
MSLLDDVSIVVTPNGYKAGELYAVVPVPTEGSELVTNGDFATDSDWTIVNNTGTDSEITGGYLRIKTDGANTDVTQTNVTVAEKQYKLVYTVLSSDGGNLAIITIGNIASSIPSSVGTHTYYFTAHSTSFVLKRKSGALDVKLDNVSVKEYTAADMDVTRATAATRVDENGLVNYAEVLGSEEIDCGNFECATPSTYWSKVNSTISSGKATVTVVGGANSYITQTLSYTSGQKYKLTATVNGTSGKEIKFQDRGNNSGGLTTTNGTVTLDGSDQNIEIYWIANSNSDGIVIARNTTSGDYIFTIDNVSVKEVTRDNVPRIDYTGGGCPHILLTSNYGVSPDGNNNSTRLQLSSNNEQIYDAITHSGNTETASLYVKGISGETIQFGVGANISQGATYTLNGEWQRITQQSTSGSVFIIGNKDLTATDFEIWGAQLEEGSYATSYIPTSGSTVTRNQDIFTRDGIGSLINSTEGVLFAEIAALSDDSVSRKISLNSGTFANQITVSYGSGGSNIIQCIIYDGTNVVVNMSYSSTNITDFNKIAIKYISGNTSLWVNGVEVDTDNAAFSGLSLSALSFDNGSSTNFFYGKVKQLQVYNTALTDEQLTSLTS